jgi:hypothetical protein
MVKRMVLAVATVGFFLWSPCAFAGVNMHDGMWEISTRMEMPGMPMQMPERTHTQCLTEENMLKTMAPKEQDQNENCKVTDKKVTGDTLTWTLECKGEDAMKVTGKTTYHGDSFEGTMTMTSSDPEEGEMKIINHIRGRRIGDCK